jgi:hypothetical protein
VVGEGQETGTVNILDDDAAPTLSVADVQVVEGNTGTRQAIFTIKLSAANETAPSRSASRRRTAPLFPPENARTTLARPES